MVCAMPKSTMKLIRFLGCAITLPKPEIMAGAMNSVLPSPIRNWLRYIWGGRVRLVARESMNAPMAISATDTINGCARCVGLSVSALITIPLMQPASTIIDIVPIWSLLSPSCWKKATAPVLCSDRQMRISKTEAASLASSPLASQRMLIMGLRRPCSTAPAMHSSAIDTASTAPSHGVCVHHSVRPKDSTTASPPAPSAKVMKVTKSSGSNTLMRSLGGSFTASTAASDISARPSSNM